MIELLDQAILVQGKLVGVMFLFAALVSLVFALWWLIREGWRGITQESPPTKSKPGGEIIIQREGE